MKNPFAILVVEDNPKHLNDFKAMLAKEKDKLPITLSIVYASNLMEALLSIPQVDAVMTDVFFPSAEGKEERPCGIEVVQFCLKEQKPVVWITSTHHHGAKTNAVSEWGREQGLEMFDCYLERGQIEAPHKPWAEALYGLIYLALCIEQGECGFVDNKLMSLGERPYQFGSKVDIYRRLFSSKEINPVDQPVLLKMVEMGFPRS